MGVVGALRRICRSIQRQNSAGLELFGRVIGRPEVLYAIQWTALLAAVVTVASLSQEIAFTSAISPSSEASKLCNGFGKKRTKIGIAFEDPLHVVCLPSALFRKSRLDYAVAPLFAALIVCSSAFFLHALALWDVA
eukprot:TRINITY_DN26911_c0_g1_i1.p1 TRINITY_DN26911_c0_g1~~TRINITY_DN26911_c0_g1_i1.p1  ORF type:complete len:136 (-),score=1.61 TRINITY_DN26911_c0_g1_i1:23-430(-)